MVGVEGSLSMKNRRREHGEEEMKPEPRDSGGMSLGDQHHCSPRLMRCLLHVGHYFLLY